MDLESHAEAVLTHALAHGGNLGEIFLEESRVASIRLEDGKIERVTSGVDVGAGLRVLAGDRTLYAHTNDVSLSGLLNAADTVAGGVSVSKESYSFDYRPERFPLDVVRPGYETDAPVKAAWLHDADKAARSYDSRVVQVAIVYSDATRRIVVANSNGRFVEETRPQILLMAHVVARDGVLIQTGYHAVGGTTGLGVFDETPPEDIALAAARQACLMLEADPAPTGRMPVVIAGDAGGVMIHEAVGHGLEADHIDKGMSKYCGRLGEPIAAPIVTVVDDGTLPGLRGTSKVDDEGTPTGRTVLIEDGRLVRFLNDLKTARKMDSPPTGNGRRESYRHKPIPRMRNTFVAPGAADPATILASTDRGLFVRRMGGGQVNPLNGDFVFEVSEGYLIHCGKIGTPVRGASLVGNGPDVLRDIDAVGTDLGFKIGTCGKDSQGAPITSGQPTLRIRELTIGGTAQR